MNEKTKQQLSMLLDGELDFTQALSLHDRMNDDPELQALWHRQNLISQALKTEPLALGGEDFVSRVSQAIKTEPTLLAPKRRKIKRVPPMAWALAASVTFLGFFAFNYLPADIDTPPANLIATQPHKLTESPSVLVRMEPSYDARFNDYLLSHPQGSLTPGMLSHARIVSYSVGQ